MNWYLRLDSHGLKTPTSFGTTTLSNYCPIPILSLKIKLPEKAVYNYSLRFLLLSLLSASKSGFWFHHLGKSALSRVTSRFLNAFWLLCSIWQYSATSPLWVFVILLSLGSPSSLPTPWFLWLDHSCACGFTPMLSPDLPLLSSPFQWYSQHACVQWVFLCKWFPEPSV